MSTTAYLDGKAVRLRPGALLAQGGEAEVYDLNDGSVLKLFKQPGHPDFAQDAAAQQLVAQRLDEHQRKLRAFPAGLPAQVVAPQSLAFADKHERTIVGYRMRKVSGEPLHLLGEPRFRRDRALTAAEVVAPLLALHDAVTALHRAGVVIGDFNDLNVLVDGARVHLIDADSYQFAGFLCAMFSERFLDPRLAQPGAMVPARPHDRDGDWFAFHVMLARTLLLVGPWGGVYQPKDPAARCTAAARPLRRISIFSPEVVWPRAALPSAALSEELTAHLAATFAGARTGAPPRRLLDELRFVTCGRCGLEHARRGCPACTVAVAVAPPARTQGSLTIAPIDRARLVAALAAGARPIPRNHGTAPLTFDGDALVRRTPLGHERIGSIVAGQTWAWADPNGRFGCGFYRAGGYTVGFVFDPARGVLDDRLRLPPLRGELIAACAALTGERAWIWISLAHRGRLTTTAIVLDHRGTLLAALPDLEPTTHPFLLGVAGACAAGTYLFVPSDAGILRLELDPRSSGLELTRTFAETAPHVCAADRLALAADVPGAIDVLRAHDAVRLTLA